MQNSIFRYAKYKLCSPDWVHVYILHLFWVFCFIQFPVAIRMFSLCLIQHQPVTNLSSLKGARDLRRPKNEVFVTLLWGVTASLTKGRWHDVGSGPGGQWAAALLFLLGVSYWNRQRFSAGCSTLDQCPDSPRFSLQFWVLEPLSPLLLPKP